MATTVTYGRSESGLNTLKTQIQSACSKKINALNGSEYTTLVKIIKENWTGADATDFLNDLAKAISNEKTFIKNKSSELQKVIDQDLRDFKAFQAKNVK